MKGFGVHTSMWTMNWDREGAERTIPAAAAYKMDFIEIALLNAPMVDAPHTRALLEKYEMPAVCSLGLPQHAWASVHPEAAIEHLKVAMDKTAEMGALALSGVTYGGIGERTGLPPTAEEYDNVARALAALDDAARAGAQLACFPELAVEWFYPQRPAGTNARDLAEPIDGPRYARFRRRRANWALSS